MKERGLKKPGLPPDQLIERLIELTLYTEPPSERDTAWRILRMRLSGMGSGRRAMILDGGYWMLDEQILGR